VYSSGSIVCFLLILRVGYCGDNLNPGSVITDDSLCSYICPGNPYEYCGASRLLDLYKLGPPGPTHLALYVQPDEIIKQKREVYNTPIIVTNGGLVADCADANYFYMVNGSLYEEGLLVGANEGLPNELFWGETTPGPIQGTFLIVDDILQWTNESFSSGQASFCVVDDILLAVFNGIRPPGCTPVYIGVANFSMCPLNLPKLNILTSHSRLLPWRYHCPHFNLQAGHFNTISHFDSSSPDMYCRV
jgi:hypothetical protein